MRFSIFRRFAVPALLAVFVAPVSAHEGQDHEASPPPTAGAAAPRASVASERFELVAAARDGRLIVHLDRFATNEPVDHAAIVVETPTGEAKAAPNDDATYRVDAPWSTKPGRYDLIFTIVADGVAEVLPATLAVPEPQADAARPSAGLAGAALAARGLVVGATASSTLLVAFGFIAGVALAMLLVLLSRAARKPEAAASLPPQGTTEAAPLGPSRAPPIASALVAVATAGVAFVAFAAPALAHEGEDHGAPAGPAQDAADRARRLPDGALLVPKSTQRLLGVRTQVAAASTHRRSIELPGRVIPDPNASGYVQASAGGRLSAPEGGFPRLGTRVRKGDVLAYVTPPLQAIDVSDMRQRQGELDQQIAIVERRIARYDTLAQKGAVTQVQLDEARLELEGLRDRRAALDRARRQPEALEAPVSGIVADVSAVAGQMAQPSAVLFHVVDPARLWVEALSFDALTEAQNATARVESRSLSLVYQGSGFAGRNQAVPVHFRIESDTSGLRVGQFVTVLAATSEEKRGIAAPRGSVVRGQGGAEVVYEHVAPEMFAPRNVRVEPLDGDRVLVVSGLSPGARIVTQGAELLDQVR